MKGRIHSKESFGTVDGPGIRYVLFMQGCPMRCLYCHNPDTWEVIGGTEITVEEVLSEYRKNSSFYKNGGITVTGGEPLLQVDFLTELFSAAKKQGIHTCIDSSGITYNVKNEEYIAKLDKLMEYVDLVMLDIKHIDPARHMELTKQDNGNILAFARYIDSKGVATWIRHVVVDGYTNDENDLYRLGEFIGTLKNAKALDVLPYHTMGVSKYAELGIKYRLEGLPAMSKADAAAAKQKILTGIRNSRNKKETC
jgi:pyruvate formate lyase activating enzyme